jgi:hypothetical protein
VTLASNAVGSHGSRGITQDKRFADRSLARFLDTRLIISGRRKQRPSAR